VNYTPISYREVRALRLSTAWERQSGDTLVSLTPYLRDNSMELLANWSLSYDPTAYTSENRSLGLMAKWRRDYPRLRARLVAGVDLDISPGGREEDRLATLTATGSGVSRIYTGYSLGTRIYDYDVTYIGASPYVHGEISPSEQLRLSAGLRYDHLSYDFDNKVAAGAVSASTRTNGGSPTVRYYGQVGDTKVSYNHLSPKLGATYALNDNTHLYAAYSHAFRAPSEGQLFRPAAATTAVAAELSAQSALSLDPVKANQYEIGLKGKVACLDYILALYELTKKDDILSYRDPATNATQSVNAGKTRHRGMETGLGMAIADAWRLEAALSYAKHTYADWVVPGTADFSGKEIESAPRVIGNIRLAWRPSEGKRLQLEWLKLGGYWLDQANSSRYAGHDLVNLRANWQLGKQLAAFGSVQNLLDERYAESASLSSGTQVFAPGLPRSVFFGLEGKW
jgi:outer membrane receptor protein involved in Fe transport